MVVVSFAVAIAKKAVKDFGDFRGISIGLGRFANELGRIQYRPDFDQLSRGRSYWRGGWRRDGCVINRGQNRSDHRRENKRDIFFPAPWLGGSACFAFFAVAFAHGNLLLGK